MHNEIVKRAPELARVLAARGAWYYDRKGEIPEGSNGLPYFELPVFNYHEARLQISWFYTAAGRVERVDDCLHGTCDVAS